MGTEKKHADGPAENGDFCKRLLWILSSLTVLCAYSAVTYIQFNEILSLRNLVTIQNSNIADLDVRVKALEEGDGGGGGGYRTSKIRHARDVPTDSLSSLVTSLVQQEVKVLENYCGNSSKICLPGQKGDAGVKGDQGQKGDPGFSGPPGPKGASGNYGPPGVPGIKGDPGVPGEKGVKGDTGDQGPKGEYGSAGIPGPKGERGSYGVPGVPGVKGEPGSAGIPGLKGQKGEEGQPLPFDQQCCSTLAKPTYFGNSTEVVSAYKGQTVTLPCGTSGYPPPTVTFSPNHDPLQKNRFLKISAGMEIRNVEFTDSGTYTCTVENIFGKTTKLIELKVTDPVVVTTSPTTVNVNTGSPFRIDCVASGHPTPTVTWELVRPDGKSVPVLGTVTGQSTNSIVVNSAAQTDAGSYVCRAQNQYEKDQVTTVVTVTGKPQIVDPPKTQFALEGSSVTLICGVASNPPATITWNFPLTGSNPPLNAYLRPDHSVLLSGVDLANSGVYTCTATNALGSTSALATLNVEKGVTVTTSPHVHPLTGNELVLNFQCTTSGVPTPTVTWMKDGIGSLAGNSKYLVLSGGNLIVTGVDVRTDTGIYTCDGQNSHGNASESVIVYKDMGQLDCTSTFGALACGAGNTCGGKCPTDCVYTGNQLYGFKIYPGESPVCTAATHTGSLPNPDHLVIWKHEGPATYRPVMSHGITSQAHAQTTDSFAVIVPAKTDGPSLPDATIG